VSIFPQDVTRSASELLKRCRMRNLRIATAESCTGGLVAACLTSIAGSSDVFDRGLVTYSNQAKIDLLGVRSSTLDSFGAVSHETAMEMLEGLFRNSAASLGISVTGIAGPGGGSVEKPVGLVYMACGMRGHKANGKEFRFRIAERNEIQLEALGVALDLLKIAADES
jgi:nicotinamide-nucleotide amidase